MNYPAASIWGIKKDITYIFFAQGGENITLKSQPGLQSGSVRLYNYYSFSTLIIIVSLI